MKILHDNRGAVTLITTMLIFLICLTVAEGIQFLGVGELQNGFTTDEAAQAFSLADGCANEGIARLRLSLTYTGETITLGNDGCVVVVSGTDAARVIDATATINGVIERTVELQTTVSPAAPANTVTVTAWREGAN